MEKLEREKGLFSFRESLDNRHECCRIRKVEPLGRALQGLAGWVTIGGFSVLDFANVPNVSTSSKPHALTCFRVARSERPNISRAFRNS